MQDWLLSDYQIGEAQGRPTNNYQAEIVFYNILPAEIIRSLFNINEEDLLPHWSFQRMFILLNEETSSLQIKFLSIDGQQEIKYNVDKSDAFTSLLSYFENSDELNEYIQFGSADTPIYLPKNPLEIKQHSLAVRTIDETLLIDELFRNPSLISSNFGGSYFTDGQRRLSVLNEGRTMEFINPIHSNERQTDVIDLLDLSIKDINTHKGWTNDYHLMDININDEMIRYRMFYDGYPIFSSNNVTMIEQEWRNQELHLYRRPLFSINNLPSGKTIKLSAGTEIVDYLKNHVNYELSSIKDIQIGYKIASFDDASYSLTIEPAWYMNYNGSWLEIRLNEIDEIMRGGS
jgi:regulatory protein YycH of two-component signal transduction system YycFG